MQQMMDEVFVGPVSVGTISQLERATTEAIAAPVEEAHTATICIPCSSCGEVTPYGDAQKEGMVV
jgi:hypothetical protein